MMKRFALLALFFVLGFVTVAYAATGFNVIPVLVTNNTGSAITAPQIPWNMSSTALVSGSWMSATALNTEVQESGSAIGSMPGTGQVRMLACYNNAGVDETTACNNATSGDITLPATASQVYEFAADSQFRHLWLNISTGATANWDIAFEYYNGASYIALAGVTDGTTELTLTGLRQVTWTFPASGLWDESALHGVTGYWMRIRVSAFTSASVAPLGQQGYYETGRWWATVPTIGSLEQKRFDVHLDTSPTTLTTTTVTIAATGDDVRLNATSGAYPPTFSSITNDEQMNISRSASGTFTTSDVFLRFNTAALPDQISPDTATLQCYVVDRASADSRNLAAEWYNWSATLGEKDYNTSAATTALAGAAISGLTSGAVNNFTLQNLHQIVKSGYTGLRLTISGGAPTGDNRVTIAGQDHATQAECSLVITYDGIRAYHNLFVHNSGYTLADNASLEPGTAFRMTWAGFITTNTAAGAFILVKGTAIQIVSTGTSTLDVNVNGVNEVDFTGVTTGYHVLTLRQVAAGGAYRLEALVDGVVTGTSSAAVTVPNNATAWTLAALPVIYQEYLEMEVGGAIQLTHQIRGLPTQTLTNQVSSPTFDVTIRYPETVDNLTVTVLPLETTGVTADDDPDPSADFVPSIGQLTNLTAGEQSRPRNNLVTIWLGLMADGSSGTIPYEPLLILFAFGICVLAAIGSWYALHSVHITWLSIGAASISFIYMGDGWWTWAVPISFLSSGLVYVFWRRAAI